jgi:hypothetical protein
MNNAEAIRLEQKDKVIIARINQLSDQSERVMEAYAKELQYLPNEGKQRDEKGDLIPWQT